MKVIASAPGKVNLALYSGPPDESGYHPLVTAFEGLSLREYVVAERSASHATAEIDARGVSNVRTFIYGAPSQGDNPQLSKEKTRGFADEFDGSDLARHLGVRAAAALDVRVGMDVSLTFHKTLPVAGGMAGGSADAAATLVAVNELFDRGLSLEELAAIGSKLGADVPACLYGGISLGVGHGDCITPLQHGSADPTSSSHWWVLAFASEGLSTPAVFRRFDQLTQVGAPLRSEALSGRLRTELGEVVPPEFLIPLMDNDLQDAALSLRPELADVGNEALNLGALAWVVSGSGPTIACLATDEDAARDIALGLKDLPDVRGTAISWGPAIGARVEDGLPEWVLPATTASEHLLS